MIKLFLIALPTFLLIDMLWLVVLARQFYKEKIGFLLSETPNWTAAIIFYVLFLIGLVVFVLQPAVQKGSLMHALLYGAFFGLVTYATYDLTNLATVKGWPLSVTIVDMLWGAVLSASVSGITFFLSQKI